ncbi:MAG: hypothetical protein ABW215_11780 [Kibdelosporangium sp.]
MTAIGRWNIADQALGCPAVLDPDGGVVGGLPGTGRTREPLRPRIPRAGLRPGDTVVLALPNSVELCRPDRGTAFLRPGTAVKFKLPRGIDYVGELPRDPHGKLHKRKLRSQH